MNKHHLFLVLLFFIGSALAQEPALVGQQLNALEKAIDKEQLTALEKEQVILESMEQVVDQLDLLTIDKQQQLPDIKQSLNSQDKIEQLNELAPIEQALLDDGFDDLDIDQELADELEQLTLPKKLRSSDMPIKNKLPSKANPKANSAVGIQGEEELIINQLDNSNLMDFDTESDVWLPELEKFPIKNNEINDID